MKKILGQNIFLPYTFLNMLVIANQLSAVVNT